MKDEAEILFQQEINSKQRERHNLRSKTGSKGSSKSRKGLRTSYDFLSKKERKNLSSEVSVKNLFDLLLTRKEFDQYPKEKQKEILTHWREIYPNSKIMEALEIKSQGTFNNFMDQLEIPKKRTYKKRIPQPKVRKESAVDVVTNGAAVDPPKRETNNISLDGLLLNYNGSYSSEQLARIFTKLQLIIEGEEIKYKVSISIQEV
jgi:hypothetical protein